MNDASCDLHGIIWSSSEIGEYCPACKAENMLSERERQLSIAISYVGRSRGNNVLVLYNEVGEFVDIVQPQTSASLFDGVSPTKLAKLKDEELP